MHDSRRAGFPLCPALHRTTASRCIQQRIFMLRGWELVVHWPKYQSDRPVGQYSEGHFRGGAVRCYRPDRPDMAAGQEQPVTGARAYPHVGEEMVRRQPPPVKAGLLLTQPPRAVPVGRALTAGVRRCSQYPRGNMPQKPPSGRLLLFPGPGQVYQP